MGNIARLLPRAGAFILAATALAAPSVAGVHEWDAEPLRGVAIKTVRFKGWLPERAEAFRGTLVLIPGRHGDGRGLVDNPRWQELATTLGFALLGCQFSDGEPFTYQNDPAGEVARAINAAVKRLAELSGSAELDKAPLAFWGTSAGSNVCSRYCDFFPARVAAFASSKGTWGPNGESTPGKAEIPMLFAIGRMDKPERVDTSLQNVEAGRKKGAPWTLAVHPREGHGVDKSLDVAVPFLKAAIEQRLGLTKPTAAAGASVFKTQSPAFASRPPAGVSAAARLEKISARTGWLGDPVNQEIAPLSTFPGNKARAVWLPDEPAAIAWQAYLRN